MVISPQRYSHWSYTFYCLSFKLQSKFLGAPEKSSHAFWRKRNKTVTFLRSHFYYREKTKRGMFSGFHDLKWQADNSCWVTPKLFTVSPTQTQQYKMVDLPLFLVCVCLCVCGLVEISHRETNGLLLPGKSCYSLGRHLEWWKEGKPVTIRTIAMLQLNGYHSSRGLVVVTDHVRKENRQLNWL